MVVAKSATVLQLQTQDLQCRSFLNGGLVSKALFREHQTQIHDIGCLLSVFVYTYVYMYNLRDRERKD